MCFFDYFSVIFINKVAFLYTGHSIFKHARIDCVKRQIFMILPYF